MPVSFATPQGLFLQKSAGVMESESDSLKRVSSRLRDMSSRRFLSFFLPMVKPYNVREADRHEGRNTRQSGGYSPGVPPLPIPNREVKPRRADGTAPQCGRVGRRLFHTAVFQDYSRKTAFFVSENDILSFIRCYLNNYMDLCMIKQKFTY